MKKILFVLISSVLVIGCANKTKSSTSKFIKLFQSSKGIEESKREIVNNLNRKNYKLVTIYNHEQDAIKLRKMLYPTISIELNNPKISTKLISCNPTLAQDLPIRLALYNNIKGNTYISYTDPEYWSLKHNIKDATCNNLVITIKQDLQEAVANLVLKEKK